MGRSKDLVVRALRLEVAGLLALVADAVICLVGAVAGEMAALAAC
jgi:hypothetical protein